MDPEWKRLRCQKISQEKRLRDRLTNQRERYQIDQTEAVIELLTSEALKMVPAPLQDKF